MEYVNIKCRKKGGFIVSKESRFNNKKSGKQRASNVEMLLMFILVGIVPFLVFGIQIIYPFYGTGEGQYIQTYDYFMVIKSRVIIAIAALMVIEKLAEYFTMSDMPKLDFKKLLKPVYVCCGLIVFSTILAFLFSDYKYIANRGALERFESIWIHFSYIVIFVYSLNFFKKENSFKVFSAAILVSSLIVGGIGTLQFLGYNPMEKDWFIGLTTTAGSQLSIKSPGSFTTLYNINTSGSYSVFVLFILGIIFVLYSDIKIRIAAVIDIVLMGITFVNSFSEASYIAFIAGFGTIVLLSIVLLFINKKPAIGGGLLIATLVGIGVVGFAITEVDSVEAKFESMLDSFIGPEATFTDWNQDNNVFYFYNNDDEYIKFDLNGSSYSVSEGENIIATDLRIDGIVTDVVTDEFGTLSIVNTHINGEEYISFNEYFYIKNVADNYMLVDKADLAEIKYVPFVGFEGYGNLFTNRGYIWSRSIPMLLERPIVGYGADVYRHVFPNYDVVGKAFNNQPMDVEVDKPHNLYLNMAINNGMLYLLGYLGIVFITFKNSFKLLFTNKIEKINKIAVILYISGLVIYLVNALSTDNIIITIALFWVYLAFDRDNFIVNEFVEIKEIKEESSSSDILDTKDTIVSNDKKEIQKEEVTKEEVTKEEAEEIKAEITKDTELKKEEINYDEIGISYADLVSKNDD